MLEQQDQDLVELSWVELKVIKDSIEMNVFSGDATVFTDTEM